MIPARLRPGIGLRPGGERPDLEDAVVALFGALYAAVVAWSRSGLDVVVDVGHHDDYFKAAWRPDPRWRGTCRDCRRTSSVSAARSR